jgi:hypothetical protein
MFHSAPLPRDWRLWARREGAPATGSAINERANEDGQLEDVDDHQCEVVLKTLYWLAVLKVKDPEFDTNETMAVWKHGLGWTTVGPSQMGISLDATWRPSWTLLVVSSYIFDAG